jgi:hypothetical protein
MTLGVHAKKHEELPLYILDYDMIEAPKHHPIVNECRGLILEENTWDVVCKPFNRFFNLGENPSNDKSFNWEHSTALDKEDGSLMNLWKYRDKLYCSTRFSFASHPIGVGLDTWENYFFSCLNLDGANDVMQDYGEYPITLSFEFCSPYNKVVRSYSAPQVFLLAAHDNWILSEISDSYVNDFAQMINVARPRLHRFANVQEVQDFIAAEADKDATFEGVVVKDCNTLRMKIKNSSYLALHRMRGNGDNMFHPKNLVAFVLQQKDRDELLVYFPEVKPFLDKMVINYNKLMKELENYWFCYHDEKSQRKFAEGVKNCRLSSILFNARKAGNDLKTELKSENSKKIMEKYLVESYS